MANDLDSIIRKAISKGIAQRLTGTLETYVRNEVLRYLNQYDIHPMSKRGNRSISLAEGRNLRRKIGSLVMERTKKGIAEGLRFKLNGLRARNAVDVIDQQELQQMIKKAIQEKLKRM